MTRRPRRNQSRVFKAKVAAAADKRERTMIELTQDFDVHPDRIRQWRDQLLQGATGVFGDTPKAELVSVIDRETLHAKIGELAQENDVRRADAAHWGHGRWPMSGALGARRVRCQAQKDDGSHSKSKRQPPGHRAGDQPGLRL